MTKKKYGFDTDGNPMFKQTSVVRNYMLNGNKISQMEATERWGFTRLSALIFTLKKQFAREGGRYEIMDEVVEGINRYGNRCKYKLYWVEKVA